MSDNTSPVSSLSAEQCERMLENNTLGRLAVSIGQRPDIYPINYAYFGGKILFRTAEGSKLAASVANPIVAFEIDGYTATSAWSVVVKGNAHVIDTDSEESAAEASGLNPWVPTIKMNLVSIEPTEITGRLFQLGIQPDISL